MLLEKISLSANKHLCVGLPFAQAYGCDNTYCVLLLRSVFVGAGVQLLVKMWYP